MKTSLRTLCAGLCFCLAMQTAAAKLAVVTTHADLAAITRAIGAERVDVTNIVEPTQDPHFVDARPHLMLALNRAELLILVGLQLEVGWLPTLLTGARNGKIMPGSDGYLDTSALVERQGVPQGEIDRSMGDLHPGGNPHFTREPTSGLRIANGIAERLSRLDPAGASDYRRNLARFERRLRQAIADWQQQIAPFKGAKVVAYHASWVYFTRWLGLQEVGFVEPKPGIPPDPASVAALLQKMRAEHVRLILQEEFYPDTTSRLLAQKSGATLILTPGGVHLDRGDDYVAYIDQHVQAVVKALSAPLPGGQP